MSEVLFMHRVDSFNYISYFLLCIFYILDLLGELLIRRFHTKYFAVLSSQYLVHRNSLVPRTKEQIAFTPE